MCSLFLRYTKENIFMTPVSVNNEFTTILLKEKDKTR